MNEVTTITADWSEAEQKFAEVVVRIIASKYRKYESEYQEGKESKRFPLADIPICADDFKEAFHIMKGIDRHRDWKGTAQWMLRSLYDRGELSSAPGTYRLCKEGLIYKYLKDKLARTQ